MSWFRNLEDASLDLLLIEGFESWVSSDLVQRPIQETVDPRRYCQMAVAAVIMGDLNAVYAVEAAHRRQLPSVPRTMLIPGCAFPRSATIGDVYIDDHISRLHLKDDFIPAQLADTLYESLGMVVSAKKCGSAFELEVWGGQLDENRGKLGFGMGRRVSLMLATGAARGLSGHDFRRFLGLWVYALSFRREALSVLDVASVAAECFAPRRRCAVEGAVLDELLVTTFLAPLLDAHLRAQPHLHLFATDASPSCAGACSTLVSQELWTLLHDFSEEKGCSVRLDWDTGSMRPPEFRDSRAAVAGLVVDLPWVESFSYRFRHPQHINLLELEALISLIRGLVDRGIGNRRVVCLVDSRVVLGSVCKGRSSSRRELPSPSCRGPSRRTITSCGPLSRCFLERCTSPRKLFLKLRSKLTDCLITQQRRQSRFEKSERKPGNPFRYCHQKYRASKENQDCV